MDASSSVPMSGDVAFVERDSIELSGHCGVKIAPQSPTAGLPHRPPPKPLRRNSSRPAADCPTPTMPVSGMTVAGESSANRTSSPLVAVHASSQEKPAENDESEEEVIPPARDIIINFEQDKLKRESMVGTMDRKPGPESRAVDALLRRHLELNLKFDSSKPLTIRKSTDRKIPPRVPAKPLKAEGKRVSPIDNNGSCSIGQRNTSATGKVSPDRASPNLGRLLREVISLPDHSQRETVGTPDCWPPLSTCGQVRRSSALFDSSSSASSLVDGQPDSLEDVHQPEERSMKPAMSFTMEDAEFSQKARSSRLMSPSPSPMLQGQHTGRNRAPGRTSNSASRRSRSVGASGLCHKGLSQHTEHEPKMSTKAGDRIKQDELDEFSSSSNSSTLIVPSPENHLGEGTHALINQKDCLVLKWTSTIQDERRPSSPKSLISESRHDIGCKSNEATGVITAGETQNGKGVSAAEKFCVDSVKVQSVSNDAVMTRCLDSGIVIEEESQNNSVSVQKIGQNDSKLQRGLEETIVKAYKDKQKGILPKFPELRSKNLDSHSAKIVSPKLNKSLTKTNQCSQSAGCLKSSAENSGRQPVVRPEKNERREGEKPQEFSNCLFDEERFSLFNTGSFADEIFQILPYDSGSSNSSIQPVCSETSGYGSVESSGSLIDVSPPRRSNDIVGLVRTLSSAVNDAHEELNELWAESNYGKIGNSDKASDFGAILRNSSGRSNEAQKKLNNRKVSRASSLRQWKRYTHKMSRCVSVKSSERTDDFDDFLPTCSDDENSDSGSESDGNDAEDIASSISKKDSEQTRHQKLRSAFHVASELLVTERNYVKKLHLIDQVFQFELVVRNRDEQMFTGDVIPQIFSNIKSIYLFHHDFLLPQLEKRMKEWDSDPRIGDVMKRFAPFLKLYSEYVKNFETAMSTINLWLERSVKFKRTIQEIQKLPECGHLNLQHHMLEPIQRVPRYQLLLIDYLRLLPHDSADREDTKEALELVIQAAMHSNEIMKTTMKFNKLREINEILGGNTDVICPTREWVKDGKIVKISARDGSHRERYLFLFSNLLLICQNLPLKIGQKQQFRINSRMDFDGMETVVEEYNLETANTFYVKGRQKSIEFHASSAEEKDEWIKTFRTVFREFQEQYQTETQPDLELGKRAPIWVKDSETSMCMCCSAPFTPFRRRHHCRACGDVVCGKCSSRRIALVYNENREKRVCDPCFRKLGNPEQLRKNSSESVNTTSSSEEQNCRKGILQVKANEPAVLSGYMNMGCSKKNLSRRFFAVHEDFVLYSYKAHQDVVAMTSLPLPGYMVARDDADERGFKVLHIQEKKMYYFQTEDKASRNRWVEGLQELVQLRMPKITGAVPRTPV